MRQSSAEINDLLAGEQLGKRLLRYSSFSDRIKLLVLEVPVKKELLEETIGGRKSVGPAALSQKLKMSSNTRTAHKQPLASASGTRGLGNLQTSTAAVKKGRPQLVLPWHRD